MPSPAPRFDPSSTLGLGIPHLACTLSSQSAGWRALLLLQQQLPPSIERSERPATPDQHLALLTRGSQAFEFLANGRWHTARKRSGDVGLSPPMHTVPHRWRLSDGLPGELLSIYLPSFYVQEAAEEYRRAGTPTPTLFPQRTVCDDPTLVELMQSLARAAQQGQPDLYAEAAARFLAAHLLSLSNRWSPERTRRHPGDDLTDTRLTRVLDFLHTAHTRNLSTDDLATVAGISPFHFARLFKRKLGITPHQYLTRLRMRTAEALLRTSDHTVLEVASTCGYTNASHFAAAFFTFFGQAPAAFRQTHRPTL